MLKDFQKAFGTLEWKVHFNCLDAMKLNDMKLNLSNMPMLLKTAVLFVLVSPYKLFHFLDKIKGIYFIKFKDK